MKTNTSKSLIPKWHLGLIPIIVVLISFFYYSNSKPSKTTLIPNLENPETAFLETQKALELLSTNLNIGMESVKHIKEYDNSKKLIFK